jgi:hypothetical protein
MEPNVYTKESLATQPGVRPAQAIPTPSVRTAGAPSGAVDQWQYSNPNPNQSRFTPSPVQDPSAKVTQYPGTATAPVNLRNTFIPDMSGDVQSNPAIPEGNTPATNPNWPFGPTDMTERNKLYAERAASAGRNAGGSAGRGTAPAPRTVQPMEAMKAPDLPEYKGVGEYTPPEEDQGVYQTARREAMGPGMRALREGTREAISSAQSLDNPNARAKFIQQALKGYGQGLESVAAGAAKEGRTEARGKRQEQLELYKTNYDIRSDTYLKNYQNQINTIAANYASEQSAQTANWNAGMDPSVNVAGQTGGGGARDKGTYYGNSETRQPFMGYM